MMPSKTTKEQAEEVVAAINKHGSLLAAARALGMTRGSMESRLRAAMHIGLQKPVMGRTVAREEPAAASPSPDSDALRDRVRELEGQLKAVKADTIDCEYVRRKIIGISEAAINATPPDWMLVRPIEYGLPGVPVTVWSDWHWGETVFKDQVNGVNEFDMGIARRRATELVRRTVDLLKHHVVNPQYPGIVVCLGGDMLTGDIHDELKETNEVPTLSALMDLFGVLCWALEKMASSFGKVFVPCVAGNHGRMTRKPQSKNRAFTNFDWLLSNLLAKHFERDERIKFYIPDGADALFEAGGRRYLLTHGDQWRGGDGIIGSIGPITRGVMKKQSRNAAIGRGFDTVIAGHFHQYMPLQRYIVNGSLKGYCEYASTNNFGFEPPTQALWISNPTHGITLHMPVYLESGPSKDHADSWVSWKD